MVFGFLEEGEGLPESVSNEEEGCREIEDLDEDENHKGKDDNGNVEEDKSFWENQHQLLQVIINYSIYHIYQRNLIKTHRSKSVRIGYRLAYAGVTLWKQGLGVP